MSVTEARRRNAGVGRTDQSNDDTKCTTGRRESYGDDSRARFTEATLWVLRDNSRARAFYGSNGFADDAGIEKTVRLGGVDLLEVRLRNQIGG
jgi:hypothetical protein